MRVMLTPRMLGAHLLALVCVGIAVALGLWQYDAWQERRQADAIDRTQLDPVPLAQAMSADERVPGDQVGRPVVVAGTWLPEATVLVSDREHDGRTGFWVVTPLTDGGPTDPALPVVLGWTESAADAPSAPTGTAEVTAWLQPPDGTGTTDADPTDDVFPQLRIADVIQRVDVDLYGAYAVARDPVGGLQPADLEELPPAGRFTALRNLLYALEWWVFGGFALFIWWRFVQDSRAEAASPDPVASGV